MSNITNIEEYYIYTNTNLLDTFHQLLIELTNSDFKVDQLLYNLDNYYIASKEYFDSSFFRNDKVNRKYYGVINDPSYKYDLNMTIYQYLLLMKNCIDLYDRSFNIDYSTTCPYNIEYYFDIDNKMKKKYTIKKNNPDKTPDILKENNILCKYYKFVHNNRMCIEPVFIGSHRIIGDLAIVYNICSNVDYIYNKYGIRPHTTSELFKSYQYFLESKFTTFALCVDSRNPSFTKAYSLYYKNGYKPMLNKIDTININLLAIIYGCDIAYEGAQYMKCMNNTFPLLLMMKSKDDSDDYIKYYNSIFTDERQVQRSLTNKLHISRISYVYDTSLAMAYRCSCIIDKYYEKNLKMCTDTMNKFSMYFTNNNNKNALIYKSHWNTLNKGISEAIELDKTLPPADIRRGEWIKNIINNQTLSRYILAVSKLLPFDKLNNITSGYKICDDVMSIVYEENNIKGVMKRSFQINLITNRSNVISNYIRIPIFNDIENLGFDNIFNGLIKYLEINNAYLQNNIYKYYNKYNMNNEENNIIFLPCGINYITNIPGRTNINHAVSFIYIKSEQRLYIYDSEVIKTDTNFPNLYKLLSLLMKDVIKNIVSVPGMNNPVKNEVHDLSRLKDKKTNESLYIKIQKSWADDAYDGGLCVLLSKLPMIVCNILYNSKIKNTSHYIKLYIWILTFYSIKKRNENDIMKINNPVQSNINIAFPYIFCLAYDYIKLLNDTIKIDTQFDKEDQIIEDDMKRIKTELGINIAELNNHLRYLFHDKDELTSSLDLLIQSI
uniref:Uncharacterized protein n=1 Tax=viral metagenome TaxID=1070528 RepID=A0A6C0I6J5_9ZZZZ